MQIVMGSSPIIRSQVRAAIGGHVSRFCSRRGSPGARQLRASARHELAALSGLERMTDASNPKFEPGRKPLSAAVSGS
jgi:hypothetical protein